MWPIKAKTQGLLSAQEAYNLWDMLVVRYATVEKVQIYQNFIHDLEFRQFVVNSLSNVEKEINELEKSMNSFGVGLPRRPPKSVRTPTNTEAIEDRFIAGLFTTMLQENISSYLRAIRTSLTNDNARGLFIKYLKVEVPLYDKAVKYFKLKGWLGNPPMYPQTPAGTREKLDTAKPFIFLTI